MQAYLSSFGSYIPNTLVSNQSLFKRISNFDAKQAANSLSKKGVLTQNLPEYEIFHLWVKQVTGIETRPFLNPNDLQHPKLPPDLTVENMALKASINAIQNANLNKKNIDHVIFSTYSGNRIMPAPVCSLIYALNLKNVSGRTLNGACSGFLDALIDAIVKIESGFFQNILVVAAEHMSNKMDFANPKSSILFSDGAGACIVSRNKLKHNVLAFTSNIHYSEQINMQRNSHIYFKGGPLVERNAVNAMHQISKDTLLKSNLDFHNVDTFIPHQANIRILNALDEKISRSPNPKKPLVVKSVNKLGNLSSAAIPVTLDLLQQKKIYPNHYQKNQLTLLSSVGGGYTYASLLARI